MRDDLCFHSCPYPTSAPTPPLDSPYTVPTAPTKAPRLPHNGIMWVLMEAFFRVQFRAFSLVSYVFRPVPYVSRPCSHVRVFVFVRSCLRIRTFVFSYSYVRVSYQYVRIPYPYIPMHPHPHVVFQSHLTYTVVDVWAHSSSCRWIFPLY